MISTLHRYLFCWYSFPCFSWVMRWWRVDEKNSEMPRVERDQVRPRQNNHSSPAVTVCIGLFYFLFVFDLCSVIYLVSFVLSIRPSWQRSRPPCGEFFWRGKHLGGLSPLTLIASETHRSKSTKWSVCTLYCSLSPPLRVAGKFHTKISITWSEEETAIIPELEIQGRLLSGSQAVQSSEYAARIFNVSSPDYDRWLRLTIGSVPLHHSVIAEMWRPWTQSYFEWISLLG